MTKLKLGNYVFLSWKGDHDPRHVHIISNGRLIAKWDLENKCVMSGKVNRRVKKLIKRLIDQGKL